MKKVLFLCTGDPVGIDGGGFATRAYLKTVCDLFEGRVDIFGEEEKKLRRVFDLDTVYVVKARTKSQIIMQYFQGQIERYSHKAIEFIKKHHNDYCCAIINGSILSGAVVRAFHKYGLPVVAIYHNFEPDYYCDNCHGLHRLIWLPPVKHLERTAYRHCDVNLFLSSQDMRQFAQVYGQNEALNSVIGVYEYENRKEPIDRDVEKKDPLTFVITGSLGVYQGADGIKYFFEELFKWLPSNSNLIVAGRNPSAYIKSLCDEHDNVCLIPNPQNMDEVISEGDVYICPTRLGGGVKLRVMDGLRLGLPVITHSRSARGYDLFWDSPAFKIFDSQAQFREAIKEIVDLMDKGTLNKKTVYDKYMEVFSYEAGRDRMKKVLLSKGLL